MNDNENSELDIDDLIRTLSYIDRNADEQLSKRLAALKSLAQAGEAAVCLVCARWRG